MLCVDGGHEGAEQRTVVRGVEQVVEVDEQVYHLVDDRVFGFGLGEVVRDAECEVEVVVAVMSLSLDVAVARGAFAYECAGVAQPYRYFGQAVTENFFVETGVVFFDELDGEVHDVL